MEFQLNEKLTNVLENSVKELIKEAVIMCSKKYNFDAEEALTYLNLSTLKITKKSNKKNEKMKRIPMPFSGEKHEDCCNGLMVNYGLYTQCNNKKEENEYCKKCNKEALKNDSGKPNNGNIEDRLNGSFIPPKNKKEVSYVKVMKKLNLTKEQVEEEAEKEGIYVDPCHFEEKVKEKKINNKSRGRPKKEEVGVEIMDELEEDKSEEEELFTTEVLENLINETSVAKVSQAKELEKEAKKAAKELEKEAKKLEKEAKKLEKEAKKLEKGLEKKAKELEKLKKGKKQVSKSQPKEEEKAMEEEKEIEEEAEEEKEIEEEAEEEKEIEEEAEEEEALKKFTFENKKYFKGVISGKIYEYELTKSRNEKGLAPIEIGIWNNDLKKIVFNKEEVAEEEEEEYSDEE
jgi:hypothetical protein